MPGKKISLICNLLQSHIYIHKIHTHAYYEIWNISGLQNILVRHLGKYHPLYSNTLVFDFQNYQQSTVLLVKYFYNLWHAHLYLLSCNLKELFQMYFDCNVHSLPENKEVLVEFCS